MSNLHFIELAAYKPPKSIESNQKEWVLYGEDDNHYQYLINSYNNSTTNNAIINNVVKLAYGKGLKAKDARVKPNEFARFKALMSNDCLKKVLIDLKLLGNFSMQLLFNGKNELVKIEHLPVQLLRANKCNENGIVEQYWYSDNWEDLRKFPPKPIPAYGFGGEIQILFGGNYSVGQKYYSNVDYLGAIPYATLEENIAEYLINEVQNGFSPTTVVNFNNGVPDEEKQQITASKVKNTLTGSNGKKVVVAFNEDKDHKTTVDSIPLNDAPAHYSYLSEECMRKIMLGHNVTSPLLFGIASTNGFSSNADELRNSFILFENMVIKPLQNVVLEILDPVLNEAGVNLNLYFETLQPLDIEGDLTSAEETTLSAEDFSDIEMLEALKGEGVDDEWELVDTREYSTGNTSFEEWANSKIKQKKTTLTKLADIITQKANDSSVLDKSVYKVRYTYEEKYSSDKTRDFCKQMVRRTANGVVYRLEDIDKASRNGVNETFGHKGQPYDLFKYKGGVNCGHFWQENLYRLKKKTDGSYVEDKALSSSQEVDTIPKSYKPTPAGHKLAPIAPKDMPRGGKHPNNKS